MKQDESFGIIPLRNKTGEWEVFLVQHKHARYWGFPKGHAETGETRQQAAIRELKEETNLDIVRFLKEDPLTEQYRFTHGHRFIVKQVFYYIAEVSGKVILQKKEIEGGLWLNMTEALAQVTHPEGKAIIGIVSRFLQDNKCS